MDIDIDLNERLKMKTYEIIINTGGTIRVNAQSLGSALVKTADLRLDDNDIVTVRLEP